MQLPSITDNSCHPRMVRTGLCLTGLLATCLCAGTPVDAELPVVHVGVVVDGPWEGNPGMRELTRSEVTTLTDGEFDVRFPDETYLIGDWTLDTARANLQLLLIDPDVDLVITWGMLASHAVCCSGALPKPVIAPVMIDRKIQAAPYDNGTSGVHNLTYVSLPNNLANELRNFRQLVPFQRVAILTVAALVEAIPRLELQTLEIMEELGLDFEYIGVRNNAAEALAAIPPTVDAVFVWPLFLVTPEERRKLIDGLNERRLPTFSAWAAPTWSSACSLRWGRTSSCRASPVAWRSTCNASCSAPSPVRCRSISRCVTS